MGEPLSMATTTMLDFKVKRLELEDQRVRLHVWDTAGQERYDALSYKYYRGANGVMLVYDITTRKSFEDVTMWLENIRKHCHQDIHAVIVGNKCDLTAERDITRQEGEQLAETLQMPFFETSAKESCNVNLAFLKLTKSIMDVTSFPALSPRYLEDNNDVQKILCTCCSWYQWFFSKPYLSSILRKIDAHTWGLYSVITYWTP